MFGIFKLKVLVFGLFLAFPALAMWIYRSQAAEASHRVAVSSSMAFTDAAHETTVRIPVEVIVTGNAPEVVYVQVGRQVVP